MPMVGDYLLLDPLFYVRWLFFRPLLRCFKERFAEGACGKFKEVLGIWMERRYGTPSFLKRFDHLFFTRLANTPNFCPGDMVLIPVITNASLILTCTTSQNHTCFV